MKKTSPILISRRLDGWRFSNLWLFGAMLVSAGLSLYAAFVLSVDALQLAANPNSTFSCDINAVISCGTVASSHQASLFGFPNAFIGLMCEPVVITIAVAGMCGTRFPRWFMAAAQFVYLLGLIFAYWLFYESFVNIGALCPYCLLITFGTTMVFFTLLSVNIRDNNLFLPKKWRRFADAFLRVGAPTLIAVTMLAIVFILIIVKYGPFLF